MLPQKFLTTLFSIGLTVIEKISHRDSPRGSDIVRERWIANFSELILLSIKWAPSKWKESLMVMRWKITDHGFMCQIQLKLQETRKIHFLPGQKVADASNDAPSHLIPETKINLADGAIAILSKFFLYKELSSATEGQGQPVPPPNSFCTALNCQFTDFFLRRIALCRIVISLNCLCGIVSCRTVVSLRF
ncbi:hypothetical protein SK128_003860 [Halocaridina rubra]|uniref:Uncharacterized protein n=1 Tax=Halocaridina rubra TaxID=373956 RepID=A0AAN8ZZB3_HALRR